MVTKQSICIFPEFSKQQIARGQPLARKLILGTMLFLPLSASLTSLPPAPGDTNITKFACLWERLGAGALRLPGWGQRRWSLFTPTPCMAQLMTCGVTQEPQLTWAGLSQAHRHKAPCPYSSDLCRAGVLWGCQVPGPVLPLHTPRTQGPGPGRPGLWEVCMLGACARLSATDSRIEEEGWTQTEDSESHLESLT